MSYYLGIRILCILTFSHTVSKFRIVAMFVTVPLQTVCLTHITFLLHYSNPIKIVAVRKRTGTDLAAVGQHPHHVADSSSATAACTSGCAVSWNKAEIYLISKHTFRCDIPFVFYKLNTKYNYQSKHNKNHCIMFYNMFYNYMFRPFSLVHLQVVYTRPWE